MIKFIEDTESNYPHRTEMNAMLADATIAFCVDFETSGEKITKKFAEKYGKCYYQVDLNALNLHRGAYSKELILISNDMKKNNVHSINIAGNGIGRFVGYDISQEKCDEMVYYALNTIIEMNDLEINTIRSGGQTGADESGLKAAVKLGIEAECLCPKGWRFYNLAGDIKNEELFKKRFK